MLVCFQIAKVFDYCNLNAYSYYITDLIGILEGVLEFNSKILQLRELLTETQKMKIRESLENTKEDLRGKIKHAQNIVEAMLKRLDSEIDVL